MAAAYIIAAKLGLLLAYSTHQVTTVWPPSGIALAVLLLLGYRLWPGILVGAFVANILTSETVAIAAGIAVGNTLEALVGTYLLRRVVRFDVNFRHVADFISLAVLCGGISTLVSATIGTSSLRIGNIINMSAYTHTWLIWWIGDMMGILILAPLILISATQKFAPLKRRFPEAGLLLILTVVTSLLVFEHPGSAVTPLAYLVFPLIGWASFGFKQIGASVIVAVIAAIAVAGTVAGRGPFTGFGVIEQNLLYLHSFLLVVATTAMLIAIAAYQRQSVEQTLRQETEKLAEANRRIHNLLEGAIDTPIAKLRANVRSVHDKL